MPRSELRNDYLCRHREWGIVTHTCHAIRCKAVVKPQLLMCRDHWFMVPVEIRKRVVSLFMPRQCRGGRPSIAWLKSAREAINSVAVQEGNHPVILPT